MRLIDADVLTQGLLVVRDRETGTPRMMAEWFLSMVRDTPTAYDVEAVVRELEKRAEYYNKMYYKHHDDEDSGRAFAYECAIDVVKRGGRNE